MPTKFMQRIYGVLNATYQKRKVEDGKKKNIIEQQTAHKAPNFLPLLPQNHPFRRVSSVFVVVALLVYICSMRRMYNVLSSFWSKCN